MLRLSHPIHHATTLSFRASSSRRSARLQVSASAAVATRTPSLYDVLSISPTARREEIKAAFKKAALRWHPDMCRSPANKQLFAEQFKRAHDAYEVLSDPLRRRCYDISLGTGGGFEAEMRRGEEYRAWEIQLEGLRRRTRTEDTWAARMRRANHQDQYQPFD